MKKLISLSLAAIVVAGVSGCAQDGMMRQDSTGPGMAMKNNTRMSMMMKMMDANNDGMISKDEFMKYHESMYDRMKKDANGMISIKDMPMMMQEIEHK